MLRKHASTIIFLILISTGLVIRLLIAPYTSGSDIAQFAGFAETFFRREWCFYKFTDSTNSVNEGWPYPWPYPYGPLPILLLSLARFFSHQKVNIYWDQGIYRVLVPVDWIIATKTIFVIFDTLAASLVYLILLKNSRRNAIIATGFYYLNPVTIYVSSIYGMIDPIPLFLLLLSIYFLNLNNTRKCIYYIWLSCFLLGLATTTKMNVLYPALFVFLTILLLYSSNKKEFVTLVFWFALGLSILYIPFELSCPSSLMTHINVLMSLSKPNLYPPIIYSFNGFTSLATYFHESTREDFTWIMSHWWLSAILFLIPLLALLLKTREKLSIIEVAYLSYLVYVVTYWCVHYQYFTILTGLASLHVFSSYLLREKKLTSIIHTVLITLWVFIFPTSWWAIAHIKYPSQSVINILNSLSLMVYSIEIYVLYSLILTFTGYITLFTHYVLTISSR